MGAFEGEPEHHVLALCPKVMGSLPTTSLKANEEEVRTAAKDNNIYILFII